MTAAMIVLAVLLAVVLLALGLFLFLRSLRSLPDMAAKRRRRKFLRAPR